MDQPGDGKNEGETVESQKEEKYVLKRGDIVQLVTDGETGVIAGYVADGLVCVLELHTDASENKKTVEDVGDVELLAKNENLESMLPKVIEITPLPPL